MTTIAYRAGVIAADTRMTEGSAIIGNVTKVVRRKRDGALIAGAGDFSWVMAFHRWALAGEKGDLDPPDEGTKGLIVTRKKVELFEVAGPIEFDPPFFAMGSGRDFAMGAMAAGADPETAVRIAMQLDVFSGGDVMVLSHDKG